MPAQKRLAEAEEPAADGAPRKKPAAQRGRVPIFVMLPLDWLAEDGAGLRNPGTLQEQLARLQRAGVHGVMADVWWGLCEPEPKRYRFEGALALCSMLKELGLKLQATMAFHKCGGNVGDAVTFPLPQWALEPARAAGLLYRSRDGVVSEDCLSLSADGEPILPGSSEGACRTPVTCYHDYIAAFVAHCAEHIGTTVVELQVGMGPCGELRYPSYMLSNGWQYPGVGLAMAHDKGMLTMLKAATDLAEPPASLPEEQNGMPDDCPLFRASNSKEEKQLFREGEGKTFLQWYSKVLVEHGRALLTAAAEAVSEKDVELSVKVSGLHWHVMHPSRATEACAGYDCCSDSQADAYGEIAKMISQCSAATGRTIVFNFTCLEMNNWSNSNPETLSAPEDLIAQVRRACIANGVPLSGENALEFDLGSDVNAFNQMNKQLRGWSPGPDKMHALTLLRLTDDFVSDRCLRELSKFVVST